MAVTAVLDLDEAARALGERLATADEHVVLDVGAGQAGLGPGAAPAIAAATWSAVPTNGRTRASSPPNWPRVQVHRAAGDVDPLRPRQRAAGRLTGLGFGLAGDAAGVDHVQLGFGLGRLHVPGGEQRTAGEHRIRLGDLAAEELDRERGHALQKVARGPARGSAAMTARDRRTLVRLDRAPVPCCPRDGPRSEERGLLGNSSPRLGPRHDEIEE